jgi:signal recognition particle subunit SRP54
LIDKAQEAFDEKEALELQRKLLNQQFTLNDFLVQLEQIQKVGSLGEMIAMLPGAQKKGT